MKVISEVYKDTCFIRLVFQSGIRNKTKTPRIGVKITIGNKYVERMEDNIRY